MQMAGVAGVEPTSAVLETVILPLNYTPKQINYIIFFYNIQYFIMQNKNIIRFIISKK